jgi:hypothetical protein
VQQQLQPQPSLLPIVALQVRVALSNQASNWNIAMASGIVIASISAWSCQPIDGSQLCINVS